MVLLLLVILITLAPAATQLIYVVVRVENGGQWAGVPLAEYGLRSAVTDVAEMSASEASNR